MAGGAGIAGGAGATGPPVSGAGVCGAGDSVTGADVPTVGVLDVGVTVVVDVSLVDVVVVTDVVVGLSFEVLSPHAARLDTASTTAPTHAVSRTGNCGFGLVGMVRSLSSGSIVAADTRYSASPNSLIAHRSGRRFPARRNHT